MRQNSIFNHASILLLAGISLVGLVTIKSEGGGLRVSCTFLQTAVSAPWGKLLDLTAMWCSFKIILLSLGLFLVIESLGTILAVLRRTTAARIIYVLHIAPCLGVLLGGYCLLKALL